MRRRFWIWGAVACLVALASGRHQAAAEELRTAVPLPPGQPIPEGFKTWALFLVCNPAWLGDDAASRERMLKLHSAFMGFGRSLGSRNAAVWFAGPSGRPENYDADRASDYCATYRLSGLRSPYVVITSRYPTETGAPGDFAAISMAGLNADNTLTLLGELADHVRASQLDPSTMDSDRYWRGWVQVLEDTINAAGRLARGLSFSVDTRFVRRLCT